MAVREELDIADWYHSSVLRGLNEQRTDAYMCDVVVCVDEDRIPAYRCVLAAASTYFRGMFGEGHFSEATKKDVHLAVNKDAAHAVINLIYTGELMHILMGCVQCWSQ